MKYFLIFFLSFTMKFINANTSSTQKYESSEKNEIINFIDRQPFGYLVNTYI